jgi:1,4-alpha-glucan branching enzyme
MAGKPKRVYFKIEAPEADAVHLCGDFNGWAAEARPLKRNPKGEWTGYLQLEPGTYEYRFLVNGEWRNRSDVNLVANPYGTENCLLVVA